MTMKREGALGPMTHVLAVNVDRMLQRRGRKYIFRVKNSSSVVYFKSVVLSGDIGDIRIFKNF